MDFELTDEQGMLRDISRSMLATGCPPSLVRSLAASGADLDTQLWKRGVELGWTGLVVPEDQDGAGQGLVELCLVAEEIGRALGAGPFTDTALIALASARWGADDLRPVVDGLVDGELTAAWAHHGDITAVRDADDLILTGRGSAVQAAGSSDWLLVTAATEYGPVLAMVDTSLASTILRRTLDETRQWYDVALDGVRVPPARVLSATSAQVQWLVDAATVLGAADCLGVGERLLEMTVEYVTIREQFDRPLGSFQSVKHKVADMLTTLKGARAATYYAAMALDAGDDSGTLAASIANAFTSEGVSELAGEALQTHGGIGFTWEHDLHLYLRRAKVGELLHSTPAEQHERILSLLEPVAGPSSAAS